MQGEKLLVNSVKTTVTTVTLSRSGNNNKKVSKNSFFLV